MIDKIKMVVLDGYTLNPGDLSWAGFLNLGELYCYDQTPSDLVLDRIGDAGYIFTNKVVIDQFILDRAPNLKYIGVLATGYNVVDVAEARKKNIVVTNVPSYSSTSVAQLVFAHILAHFNRVEYHNDYIKAGGWCRSEYDSFFLSPQTELAGKTMGVVGYGHIGSKVARIARGFEMNVLIASQSLKENLPEGILQVSVEELFQKSDVVSLNCPLNEQTKGMVNRNLIGLMKKNALLVNTGRGTLINEDDLAEALNAEQIAGASLDVLSVEPPKPDNPLLTAKNCLLTSHLAWSTFESRSRLMNMALSNLKAFLDGHPVNVVLQ